MTRPACLLLLSAALVLTGCVSATTSEVPGVSFDKLRKGVSVRVYASEIPSGTKGVLNVKDAPSGTKLGTVAINGAEAASWNKVISKARKEAAKMGADVLIVEQWGYVPVSGGFAYGGGMAVPVTSTAKGLTAEARRTSDAHIPDFPGLKQ